MASTLANKIDILEKSIQTALVSALTEPVENPVYSQIATIVPTPTPVAVLPIGLPIKQMSEQTAESATWSGLDLEKIEVATKKYITGFSISLDDMQDYGPDSLIDMYTPRLNELTAVAQQFYDKLILDYIVSNPTTFTGESLFSNSQTWGGRSAVGQDNLLGVALDSANIKTALSTLRSFKDQFGQPIINSGKINLIVPPGLEWTARELVQATINASGASNILQGAATVVSSPFLTDSNDWYLTCGQNQLMIVERSAAQVKMIVDEDKDVVKCKVTLRAAPAVGSWTAFLKSVV